MKAAESRAAAGGGGGGGKGGKPTGTGGSGDDGNGEEKARRLDAWRSKMLSSWVRGSSRRDSVLLKVAVKDEFGLKGPLWKPGKHKFKPEEIAEARQAVRRMYQETQEQLKAHGVENLHLLRGISSPSFVPGSVEGWTTSLDVARQFGKYGIIEAEVPVRRILAYSGGPGWRNGPHGEEWEHLVLGEDPS